MWSGRLLSHFSITWGEKTPKGNSLDIFHCIKFALNLSISSRWWLWHLCHLDFKIIWFIFLVQHITSLSQKIRQYVTNCTFYSKGTSVLCVVCDQRCCWDTRLHTQVALASSWRPGTWTFFNKTVAVELTYYFSPTKVGFLTLLVICHNSGLLPSLF